MRTGRWSTSGIELVDVELGPVPAGWVRLRVAGCGICGTDLHLWDAMRAGTLSPGDFPTPGHEMAGTIVDAPAGMADAVYAIEPWVSCEACVECLGGNTNRCERGQLLGLMLGGGLAEFVDAPTRLVHPVDARVSSAVASLAEPWAVAVRAIHRAHLDEFGERVLILGGGSIGLLCGLAARERADRVGVTCRHPHQAEFAQRFGLEPIAPAAVDDWAAEYRPGVVIESVGGEADTMMDAVRSARRGGRIVVVGYFAQPRPTDWVQVMAKELEIVGSLCYGTVRQGGSEFGAAVQQMGSVAAELASLQTHRVPLDAIVEGFEIASDKSSGSVKVTIGSAS